MRGEIRDFFSQSVTVLYLKVLNRGTFEIKQAVFRRGFGQSHLKPDSDQGVIGIYSILA